MSDQNDDLDGLEALLEADAGLSPAPAKKAAAKKVAEAKVNKTDPVKPVAEFPAEGREAEVSEVSVLPGEAVMDPATMQEMFEQMQRTIEEQKQQIEAMRAQPPTQVVNNYNSGELNPAVLARKQPNSIDAGAVLGAMRPEDNPEGVEVHFLADGFTSGARMFYRGETTRLSPDLAGLTSAQQRLRYGQVMFAPGPWQGEGYDLNDPALTEDERQRLARIVAEQQAGFAGVVQKHFDAQMR